MHSTLKLKPTDDPHDFVVVAPDAVQVAPAEDEISNLLREAARQYSGQQTHTASDLPAAPPVPPVDTTFRPAAAGNVHRRSMAGRALRAFAALLLAACIGLAGIAWQSDAAKKMIAKVATQLVVTSSEPAEQPGSSAQPAKPAVEMAAASAASQTPAPPAQTAPAAVVPAAAVSSPDSSQLLQSMARDLASAGQEIEQLKASIEQLKASQQQMSRDMAKTSEAKTSESKALENKASEQNSRPRISALPPRPAAAPARRPIAPYPPRQAATAATYPQAAAPYVPRQIEPQPQTTAPPQADPELSSVPRPPMPLR
ncbi:MAG: hypothetical protein QOI87_40 [Bradyrhizobium sp.]|jgi:hypothetical protein|nr:hypothetical protein [Bradyrhizobium sp.]